MSKLHPATARRSSRSVAKLQARDVDRVVNRSGVLASRLWRMTRDAVEARGVMSSGKILPFTDDEMQPVVDELTDLMSFAYLLRKKLGSRRRRASKDVSVKMASTVNTLARSVAKSIDVDLGNVRKNFVPVSKRAVKATARDIRNTVNRALAEATREGLTTGAGIDLVLDAVRRHGVEPRSTAYVETLVRTHAGIAYGAAHRQSFAGDVDLWGFEYVTVGDNRVREEHELLDGVMRKADDPFWDSFWPPNGYNCRCQAVAIYDQDAVQTRIPAGAEPDEGFDTDFTELFG